MAAILLLLIFGSVSLLSNPQAEEQNHMVTDVSALKASARKVGDTIYFSPIMSVKSGSVAWARLEEFDEPLHYHNHGELLYVLDGELEVMYVDGESNKMGPGQFVLASTEIVWAASGSADILLFQTGEESDGPGTTWLGGPNETPDAVIPSQARPANIGVIHSFEAGLPEESGDYTYLEIHESLSTKLLLIDLQGELDWHSHEVENEVVYVVSGQGLLMLEDEVVILTPGDVVEIPTGLEHKATSLGGDGLQVIVFQTL
jgi:mannose-6-phosphate isomerase-like protein (cupin superfamily)